MNFKKVSRRITQHCAMLGVEITFSEAGADIYWRDMRVQPSHEDLADALLAISVLNDIGIQDA